MNPMRICCRFSPLSPMTCWSASPEFLGCPLIQPGGQVQADLAPLRENAYGNIPGCVLPGPPHQRWQRDSSQPPKILQLHQARDTCVHIPTGVLRCVSWKTRGLLGSTASSQVSRKQKQKYSQRLTDKNDVICLQETHGKDEFSTSPSGTTHSISDVWYTRYCQRKRWRIGHFHPKHILPDRAIQRETALLSGQLDTAKTSHNASRTGVS